MCALPFPLSRSSAAPGSWGGLEEQPQLLGAVLRRELDRHLADQRLGPRLLRLVLDDVRRCRDALLPLLVRENETPTEEVKTVETRDSVVYGLGSRMLHTSMCSLFLC